MKAVKENVVRFGEQRFASGDLVSVSMNDGCVLVGYIGFINDFGFSLNLREPDGHAHAKVIQFDWVVKMGTMRQYDGI